MTWTPNSSTSEHLGQLRAVLRNEDAEPHQVLTPIIYMRSGEQHLGWAYAEKWLRYRRVQLMVASTSRSGWFSLCVMWFPDVMSRIHFDCRLGHRLRRSPEGVAARALNIRYVSGLPIKTGVPQVTNMDPMIQVGGPLGQYLGPAVPWNSRPSRVFPWELQSDLLNHNPKDGAPFVAGNLRRYKQNNRIGFLGVTELPIRPYGWCEPPERAHYEGVRSKEIIQDLSVHLSPITTTRPPWC